MVLISVLLSLAWVNLGRTVLVELTPQQVVAFQFSSLDRLKSPWPIPSVLLPRASRRCFPNPISGLPSHQCTNVCTAILVSTSVFPPANRASISLVGSIALSASVAISAPIPAIIHGLILLALATAARSWDPYTTPCAI